MDNMLELSVSSWGITLSTDPLYFNLSWGLTEAQESAILAQLHANAQPRAKAFNIHDK